VNVVYIAHLVTPAGAVGHAVPTGFSATVPAPVGSTVTQRRYVNSLPLTGGGGVATRTPLNTVSNTSVQTRTVRILQ